MGLFEMLGKIAMSVIPPRKLVGDPGYHWSIAISTLLMVQGVVIVIHIFLIWGLIPILFAGFASKNDIATEIARVQAKSEEIVKQSTDEIKAELITGRIYQYRNTQCRAIRENNQFAAQALNVQIEEARSSYYRLTNQVYDLRPCIEFGF